MNWLKHAFAIDKKRDAAPSAEQTEAIDRVIREIHRRQMAVPASMLLETCRPLNYVGSQLLVFFSPVMKIVLGVQAQDAFAKFLEQRGSIDYLLHRLEQLDPTHAYSDLSEDSETDGRGQ